MSALGDSSAKDAARAEKVMKRYGDGYMLARTVVIFGTAIQIVGFMLAIAGAIVVSQVFRSPLAAGVTATQSQVFSAVAVAAIIGFVFWVAGMLVSSVGQFLKASLDCAVNSSPFLDNDDKASIMSLGGLLRQANH